MGDSKGPETFDHVSLRGRRDFAIYYGPASVPVLAALLFGLDLQQITWLIWLELLPRGFLLSLELMADKDFKDNALPYRATLVLVVLGACAGAMAFVAMFFPMMRAAFEQLFTGLWGGDAGGAVAAFYEQIGGLPVVGSVVVAAMARGWRAFRIDVHQDPEMAHVRHDTKERRTRRMFSFVALIAWIVAVDYLGFFARIAPRFFGTLAAALYCYLPLVAIVANELRRRLAPYFKPA